MGGGIISACFLVVFLPVLLLIGAVILRSAVSTANWSLGGSRPIEYSQDDDDWSDYPQPGEVRESTGPIPTPSVGRGMFILLAVVIVNAVLGIAIQMVFGTGPFEAPGGRVRGARQEQFLLSLLVNLPISFLLLSMMLTMMLPTRFGRGCRVAFYFLLFCLGLLTAMLVPILAIRIML